MSYNKLTGLSCGKSAVCNRGEIPDFSSEFSQSDVLFNPLVSIGGEWLMAGCKKGFTESMQNKFKELPANIRDSVLWVMDNFEIIEAMCKNSTMTLEEITMYQEEAKRKNDCAMFVLLCTAKAIKELEIEGSSLRLS